MSEVLASPLARISSGVAEFDRVLGGGFVAGELLALSGDPGIGKSTLALEVAAWMAKAGARALYVAGEESEEQVATRAARLPVSCAEVEIVSTQSLDEALGAAAAFGPEVVVWDSMQALRADDVTGFAGGAAQVRAGIAELQRLAKGTGAIVIVISHVTKEGEIAGPEDLVHAVDAHLHLEGDLASGGGDYRCLRSMKNRFGATSEIGLFEMTEKGLEGVVDAGALFVDSERDEVSGAVRTVTREGSRCLVVEVEALLVPSGGLQYPRRSVQGFDLQRLHLLLAALERRAQIQVRDQDVYVNVTGGYRLRDPGCDLAVCLAIASARSNKVIDRSVVALGEVGLSGAVRRARGGAARIREAARLGYRTVVAPVGDVPGGGRGGAGIVAARTLAEAVERLGVRPGAGELDGERQGREGARRGRERAA
jgi:DNA repair protein RadA/Sms